MLLAVDDTGREPCSEEVPLALVAPVHALGVDAYNIAHPATFVVAADGKICWIAVSPSQNERPRLEDLFAAIEACGKY